MFHILVVDDDKNTRKFMRAVLEVEGYTVSAAENGEEALAIMESEYIDLAVVDITMPKMDGYEFTAALREVKSKLPILMVSAKQLSSDRKKSFIAGIDDYMSKPVDGEELVLHIRALLRRAQIASERKITFGNICLDYDSLTVTRGDTSMELPQKEFQLLYLPVHVQPGIGHVAVDLVCIFVFQLQLLHPAIIDGGQPIRLFLQVSVNQGYDYLL